MVARGTFYGVVAVLLAVSLISSSMAVSYYGQEQRQASEAQHYAGELSAALAQYRTLDSSYQRSLDGYNRTMSMLAQALGALNTTSAAYRAGSAALGSLWRQYLNLSRASGQSISYSANMLLDYGNGTELWYNDTVIQPGWNAYLVTLVALNGSVQATWYPSFGEHFVSGLRGVENNPSSNQSWLLWTLNSSNDWQPASVGPDQTPVYNGTTFSWAFCPYDPVSYAPLCTP